jgi:hypothetical protein
MPPKKTRSARQRRPMPTSTLRPTASESVDGIDGTASVAAPTTSAGSPQSRAAQANAMRRAGAAQAGSLRRRAGTGRQSGQIVIANYDFLRHDLRLLGLLAPTLIVILIVLSFVVH